MSNADFLVEIGTEELPPKALRSLMDAFGRELERAVDEARLKHGTVHAYASPRRLAVLIEDLAAAQPDRVVEQKGPPVTVAFDDDGQPTPAALAFARKCGVDVAALGRTTSGKGEWLHCEQREAGRSATELMPELVAGALAALPIPRRMRWGAGDVEFVRPVHWVVMLHGKDIVDGVILGMSAGRTTRGHRFLADEVLTLKAPADYLRVLEEDGRVIADFARRRELVADGVARAAKDAGGDIVDGELLYDEVAALVEWPVPIVGSFDEAFLDLPPECVTSTLTGHQRYFPMADEAGRLLPRFVTVANLETDDPDPIRDGNERVVRPRLADAAFFWDNDRRVSLHGRRERLADVVYQQGLGSLADKSARIGALAAALARELGARPDTVERAALLAKCDLLTGMVGEFPDLQGVMGRYYALADGESDTVATAIGEHYLPRFAGDALPESIHGQILAVADKLDTIAGIFALGKKPSGNRDPFALRRAALGVIRIVVESGLDLDLQNALALAVALQPIDVADEAALAGELYDFVTERVRRYFLDRDPTLTPETFDAVLARRPTSLVDFAARLAAVQAFVALDEAASLAAANKRIANILRKSAPADADALAADPALFTDEAERRLHSAVVAAEQDVAPLLEDRDYTDVLRRLATLREPVDRFFDEVLVMAEDASLRRNRLALLATVRALFWNVADISRLAID